MKQTGIVIVVIAVILGAIFFFGNTSDAPNTSTQPDNTRDSSSPQTTTEQSRFNAEEVARHNAKDDCWTIINDSVYNITSYIPRHEGGDEILRACGTDGTKLFTTRTTDNGESIGSGTPHSRDAQAALDRLKIGIIEN